MALHPKHLKSNSNHKSKKKGIGGAEMAKGPMIPSTLITNKRKKISK